MYVSDTMTQQNMKACAGFVAWYTQNAANTSRRNKNLSKMRYVSDIVVPGVPIRVIFSLIFYLSVRSELRLCWWWLDAVIETHLYKHTSISKGASIGVCVFV